MVEMIRISILSYHSNDSQIGCQYINSHCTKYIDIALEYFHIINQFQLAYSEKKIYQNSTFIFH